MWVFLLPLIYHKNTPFYPQKHNSLVSNQLYMVKKPIYKRLIFNVLHITIIKLFTFTKKITKIFGNIKNYS